MILVMRQTGILAIAGWKVWQPTSFIRGLQLRLRPF
jgi:hypothetical protein